MAEFLGGLAAADGPQQREGVADHTHRSTGQSKHLGTLLQTLSYTLDTSEGQRKEDGRETHSFATPDKPSTLEILHQCSSYKKYTIDAIHHLECTLLHDSKQKESSFSFRPGSNEDGG